METLKISTLSPRAAPSGARAPRLLIWGGTCPEVGLSAVVLLATLNMVWFTCRTGCLRSGSLLLVMCSAVGHDFVVFSQPLFFILSRGSCMLNTGVSTRAE
mmetsp:Transcript_46044/g.104327  ORF Transcript_46044/g.104327 Transcript_46044/m.104327 type:complete len:101 (-) Transcript_46044:231-533(-)